MVINAKGPVADFLMQSYIFSRLSTRPEKFLGDIEIWDRAEKEWNTLY
jgi:hypothetical protein